MQNQNDIEYLQDLLQRGQISVEQANIQLVLDSRIRVIKAPLPKNIRKALCEAVKAGILGHYKKDGYKPEVFYNPSFDYLARSERNKIEAETLSILKKCAGFPE